MAIATPTPRWARPARPHMRTRRSTRSTTARLVSGRPTPRAAVGGRRPRLWRAIGEGAVRPGRNRSGAWLRPGCVGLGARLRPVGGAGTGLGPGAAGLQPGLWRPARRDGLGSGGRGESAAPGRRTGGRDVWPRGPGDNPAGWRRLGRRRRPGDGSGLAGGRPGQGAGAVRRRSALRPASGIRAARGLPRSRLRLCAVRHVPRVHADDRPHRRRRRRRAVGALAVRAELPRAQLSGSQPFGLAGRHRRRVRRGCPGGARHLCRLRPVPGRSRRRVCPPGRREGGATAPRHRRHYPPSSPWPVGRSRHGTCSPCWPAPTKAWTSHPRSVPSSACSATWRWPPGPSCGSRSRPGVRASDRQARGHRIVRDLQREPQSHSSASPATVTTVSRDDVPIRALLGNPARRRPGRRWRR